jgi:hypothetical protein
MDLLNAAGFRFSAASLPAFPENASREYLFQPRPARGICGVRGLDFCESPAS